MLWGQGCVAVIRDRGSRGYGGVIRVRECPLQEGTVIHVMVWQ